MQGWIENPKGLQKVLAEILCPPPAEPKSFIRDLGVILTISAQPQCVVADCFTDKKIFVWRDNDFDSLLPQTLPASKKITVSGFELTEFTTEETFIKIGKPFTNLLQIEDFILRTEGEKTGLRKDGYASIFFLQVGSSVFAVSADRLGDGWRVLLYHFAAGDEWPAEDRFFSLAT
ncbi:MAG: hypothetical protein G01um101417_128 [Parcubacteria group bacterium Gr01-1014_17]|nr:MAG: hypothetical protein G01um101417_128 [Parcubacteria group bacterium Gr01-1014_17]